MAGIIACLSLFMLIFKLIYVSHENNACYGSGTYDGMFADHLFNRLCQFLPFCVAFSNKARLAHSSWNLKFLRSPMSLVDNGEGDLRFGGFGHFISLVHEKFCTCMRTIIASLPDEWQPNPKPYEWHWNILTTVAITEAVLLIVIVWILYEMMKSTPGVVREENKKLNKKLLLEEKQTRELKGKNKVLEFELNLNERERSYQETCIRAIQEQLQIISRKCQEREKTLLQTKQQTVHMAKSKESTSPEEIICPWKLLIPMLWDDILLRIIKVPLYKKTLEEEEAEEMKGLKRRMKEKHQTNPFLVAIEEESLSSEEIIQMENICRLLDEVRLALAELQGPIFESSPGSSTQPDFAKKSVTCGTQTASLVPWDEENK